MENKHEPLECSSCGKQLLDILVIQPGDVETTLFANCPFCGDKSYHKKVKGLFYIGNTEECVKVDVITQDDDVVRIETVSKV